MAATWWRSFFLWEMGTGKTLGMDALQTASGIIHDVDAVGATAREVFSFAPWARIVGISAKTGRSLGELFEHVEIARASRAKRITTSEMNRFFEEVLAHHPPPTQGGPILGEIPQAVTADAGRDEREGREEGRVPIARDDLRRDRVKRDLARREKEAAGLRGLRVGADGLRGGGCCDYTFLRHDSLV